MSARREHPQRGIDGLQDEPVADAQTLVRWFLARELVAVPRDEPVLIEVETLEVRTDTGSPALDRRRTHRWDICAHRGRRSGCGARVGAWRKAAAPLSVRAERRRRVATGPCGGRSLPLSRTVGGVRDLEQWFRGAYPRQGLHRFSVSNGRVRRRRCYCSSGGHCRDAGQRHRQHGEQHAQHPARPSMFYSHGFPPVPGARDANACARRAPSSRKPGRTAASRICNTAGRGRC